MIESGDLNNDGLTDIAVTCLGIRSGLAILLQNSYGTFDAPVYHYIEQLPSFYDLAIGDVNGDSRNDLVATKSWNKVNVFLQNTQGALEQPNSYALNYPEPVVIEDVNNDGRQDVIVVHGGWLTGLLQERNGQLGKYIGIAVPYQSHYHPQGLAVGDINGDGRNDAIITHYEAGLVMLYNIY